MYYNKRDKYGRFTKENKAYTKKVKKLAKELPYNMSWTLIEGVKRVLGEGQSFEDLEKWYMNIMDHMKSIDLPEYDAGKDLMPFFKAMFDFYGLAIEGTIVARELDKRAAEKECKPKAKKQDKKVLKDIIAADDFKGLIKLLADEIGVPENEIEYCVAADLDTGKCCGGRCKHKKK